VILKNIEVILFVLFIKSFHLAIVSILRTLKALLQVGIVKTRQALNQFLGKQEINRQPRKRSESRIICSLRNSRFFVSKSSDALTTPENVSPEPKEKRRPILLKKDSGSEQNDIKSNRRSVDAFAATRPQKKDRSRSLMGLSSFRSMSLLDRSETNETLDHRFEEFCANKISAYGYLRTDDDTITLFKDGHEVVVIRRFQGVPRVTAATPDFLFNLATLEDPSGLPEFQLCFALTYRDSMKPHDVLIKLVAQYKELALGPKSRLEQAMPYIVSFVQNWIELSWEDFRGDERLLVGLERFLEILSGKDAPRVTKIRTLLEELVSIIH
jgi:hypothetical protein